MAGSPGESGRAQPRNAPSLAVILFGLGVTARDGLVLGLGIAALTAGLWFTVQAFA
jgi:hypothetical protein